MDRIAAPLSMVAVVGRLMLATAFGLAIGVNRERLGKPAGLRTHGLVALGAAVLTVVGLLLGIGDASAAGRVLQGIVAGVGFIGAGVIMHGHDEKSVHGLTTAAAIWVAAAVGIAAGAGLWRTGLAALIITLVVLAAGEAVDRWIHRGIQAERS